jgi:hypothetical protein
VLTTAAALVTLSGAVAVIIQIVHWLDRPAPPRTAVSGPSCIQIERTLNNGLSFHQDGQQDPMAYCNPTGPDNTFTVSMKSGPFELWFPALVGNSAVQVCASTSSAVFADASAPPASDKRTCLTPGTGVADAQLGGGFLAMGDAEEPVHTEIAGNRPQAAANGYQKYYVSTVLGTSNTITLTNFHDRLYLVIAIATDANDPSTASIEEFTLYFER